MTGQKNRFTTIEKTLNLEDNTIATPEHDEMVLWLLNKTNLMKAIPSVKKFIEEDTSVWTRFNKHHNDTADMLFSINNFWEKLKTGILPDEDIKSLLEIKKRNLYSHQYDELNITKEFQAKWLDLIEEYVTGNSEKTTSVRVKDISILSEKPITKGNGYIVGYWDIVINYIIPRYGTKNFTFWRGKREDIDNYLPSDFIEVKPKINSFGATLRQLKTYQEFYHGEVSPYLFTKDLRFKDAFESQGIHVIDANIMNNP